jgi:hypothetical protein
MSEKSWLERNIYAYFKTEIIKEVTTRADDSWEVLCANMGRLYETDLDDAVWAVGAQEAHPR